MYPFSIRGSLRLDGTRHDDTLEVARGLEHELQGAPWLAEREENRLHFNGGVYTETSGGWRSLLTLVGACWLEVVPGPELTLEYKASTGEMVGLVFAVAIGLGILTEVALRMPAVAIVVALAVGFGGVAVAHAHETRRLRTFLLEVLARVQSGTHE